MYNYNTKVVTFLYIGMQSGVLVGAAPYALPLKFQLMPQFFNKLGYKSMAVGKW